MKPTISVQGLGKSYRLCHAKGSGTYKTMRESLTAFATAPLARLRSAASGGNSEEFWALKDIQFEVRPGEVVGIIGRNGAGKSTLLKILSRITKPTTGRVRLCGRIGSLLEVGTGFHPELSGRENIFLNGSILGMTRREIARRFDEIVAFAEVDKFLDTPVKRYSSGMYVRLAFAVAAHLEPEILVVDEVLAVGDSAFQKKCLGKMHDVSKGGRTVLFVSHNMAAVRALCPRSVLLSGGKICYDGSTDAAISEYVLSVTISGEASLSLTSHEGRSKGCQQTMTSVIMRNKLGEPSRDIYVNDPLSFEVSFVSDTNPIRPVLGVVIKDQFGGSLFGINNRIVPGYVAEVPLSRGSITLRYPAMPLGPGRYTADLYFGNEYGDIDVITDALDFTVHAQDIFGSGKLPPPAAGPFISTATWLISGQ